MDVIRKKYIQNHIAGQASLTIEDIEFLAEETNTSKDYVMTEIAKYDILVEGVNE